MMESPRGKKRRASGEIVRAPRLAPTLSPASQVIENHEPLKLPNEIWEVVFKYLSLNDLKNVRLAWRRWTSIASRLLFKIFVLKIDRKDFERFETISQRDSSFVDGIRTLRFETGFFGLDLAQYQLGEAYQQMVNDNRLPSAITFNSHTDEAIEADKATAIAEYAAWNVRWHDANQNYRDLAGLKSILSQLKSLDAIEITSKDTAFRSMLMVDTWINSTGIPNFAKAPKDFMALLVAIQSTPLCIKRLYHDSLAVTFFARSEKVLTNLAKPLQYLTTLQLSFEAISPPHVKFWSGLGCFLKAIPNLETLRFGFASITFAYADGSEWQRKRDNDPVDWYVPLWRMLGDRTWHKLRKLRLDGLLVCEQGLFELLNRHSDTLRVLDLFNLGLWFGSVQSLLSRLRTILRLESFHAWGELRAIHAVDEHWRIFPDFKGDDEAWSPEFKTRVGEEWAKVKIGLTRCGDCSPDAVGGFLECIMTSGPLSAASWPLKPSDTVGEVSALWRANPRHSIACQFCDKSINEINEKWNEDMKKPLVGGWRDLELPEGPGIGEDLFISFYNEYGLDENGYDEDGYDEHGQHYLDFHEDWHGLPDPLSMVAARRQILEGLLNQIPRYAALQRAN